MAMSGNFQAAASGRLLIAETCRYGEALHWTRDDAKGTWNYTRNEQASLENGKLSSEQAHAEGAREGDASVKTDMDDEVCTFSWSRHHTYQTQRAAPQSDAGEYTQILFQTLSGNTRCGQPWKQKSGGQGHLLRWTQLLICIGGVRPAVACRRVMERVRVRLDGAHIGQPGHAQSP